MNMKTLLGTAAGLMVATSAYAADLPGDAVPAAVDYVKVCTAAGDGYFYIPNSETCLKISGRVRVKGTYSNNNELVAEKSTTFYYDETVYASLDLARAAGDAFTTTADYVANVDADNVVYATAAAKAAGLLDMNAASAVTTERVVGDKVKIGVDGLMKFSAVTASDLGNVESYFEVSGENGDITLGDAFIKVGYLQVGKFGDIANGDMFYGITGQAYGPADTGTYTLQVKADDLGGGFWAGATVSTLSSAASGTAWDDFNGSALDYTAAVGIKGQSWGGAELSFGYLDDAGDTTSDLWFVRGVAELKLIDRVEARLTASYADKANNGDDFYTLSGAVKFAATDSLSLYTGVRGDFFDTAENKIYVQAGAAYAIASGLTLEGEVHYVDQDTADVTTSDAWTGIVRLKREW